MRQASNESNLSKKSAASKFINTPRGLDTSPSKGQNRKFEFDFQTLAKRNQKQSYDLRKNFLKAMKASKVKKVIVYEDIQEHKV
jgi:hypothetical protein